MSETEKLKAQIAAIHEGLAALVSRLKEIEDAWTQLPPNAKAPASQPAIPNFDPEELMKHSWKGKKVGDKEYSNGSLSWGWDFRENFAAETIQVLEKGPLVIGEYEFTLTDRIVQTKKVKK